MRTKGGRRGEIKKEEIRKRKKLTCGNEQELEKIKKEKRRKMKINIP